MAKESQADLKKRTARIVAGLRKAYPDARCQLDHANPLQLLVATILSAQCTDRRVNMVTQDLFGRYKTVADYASATQENLEREIRTTGFFRNKAKNIRGTAQRIAADFGGRVPRTMSELLTLPGVARKTANVVLGTAFGISEGVVVDTHVSRISQRLELTKAKTPEKIERDLMALVPRRKWTDFSHLLIFHGRRCCAARKPQCSRCCTSRLCPSAFAFEAPPKSAKRKK